MIILSIAAFLVMIVLVVAVHEWGHYAAARFFGVCVKRFSVGFGKPLWSRVDSSGTQWILAPIPLGGYVQLLTREMAKELNMEDKHTMDAQNNWRKFIIYAAGPMANIILSIIILTGILMGGETGLRARIGEVNKNSIAAQAGLTAGDEIININGRSATLWSQAAEAIVDEILLENSIAIKTNRGVYEIPSGALEPQDIEAGLLDSLGLYPQQDYITPTIDVVMPDSPAQAAGLQKQDVIVALDGVVFDNWRHIHEAIRARPGKVVPIVVWRGQAEEISLVATLTALQENDDTRIGRLGVVPQINFTKLNELLITAQLNPIAAVARATQKVSGDITRTLLFIGHIVSGQLSFRKNISGPVGIAQGAGVAANSGWESWWRFVAIISTSLAVINLLPLPLLDGGHMAICVIQGVIRRPIPARWIEVIERLGVVLLVFLLVTVIASDLAKLL